MLMLYLDSTRPGVGGSTAVPLDQRVQVWLQAVPVVLEKLKVKTVALVSHSAGAIYAVNVLLRLPHLVHPTRPFAAMLSMFFIFPLLCSSELCLFSICLPFCRLLFFLLL